MPNESQTPATHNPLAPLPGTMTAPQRPIPLVLSVDWDYFQPRTIDDFDWPGSLPDPDPYDILLWQSRAFARPITKHNHDKTAYELLRVDPNTVECFLNQVIAQQPISEVRICDSHKEIVDFTQDLGAFDVLNFDAHQDVSYEKGDAVPELNCGNWAGHLRKSGKLNSYTLVYPRWRHQQPERPDFTLPEVIDRLVYGDWPGAPVQPTKLFVCRSSSWMPSWCDKEWLHLIALLRERAINSFKIDANVSEARPFDLQKARKLAADMRGARFSGGPSLYDDLDQCLVCIHIATDMLVSEKPSAEIKRQLDEAVDSLQSFREDLLGRGVR